MMRTMLTLVCISFSFAALVGFGHSDAKSECPKSQWASEKIAEYLSNKSIETSPFAKKMQAKEFFEGLKRIARKDEVGFEFRLDSDDRDDPYELEIELPETPKRMSMNTAIKLAVSQLPANVKVSFRKGLVVVSSKAASSDAIIVEGLVIDGSLESALSELSNRFGVNIVIDERVREKAKKNIRAKFVNSVKLESVIFVLTNMSDLDFVHVEENLYYVTSPSNATESKRTLRK